MKIAIKAGIWFVSLLATVNVSASDAFQVMVRDSTLTWGAQTYGYLQVQDESSWQTLCEFQVYALADTPSGSRNGTACTVTPGIYTVINHATRQRIQGLSVGDLNGLYTAPPVETIDDVYVRYDPYLVIDASEIHSQLYAVDAPGNLRAQVYSSTAAELFWNRAAEPGLQYSVFLGSTLLGSTNGTSLFLNDLSPGETYEFEVIARNSVGAQSSGAMVSLRTTGQGNSGNNSEALTAPTGLRAAVYSPNTLELFWDRQGSGQLFAVFDGEGELLARTDGTSHFLGHLPLLNEHAFSVVAIDENADESAPASIVVTMGSSGVDPDTTPAMITIDNAESLLAQLVVIANRAPFDTVQDLMQPGVDAVRDSSRRTFFEADPLPNGLTLIEGSLEEGDASEYGGIYGGRYTCDAGGTAEGLALLTGFGLGDYVMSLEQCELPGGRYSGVASHWGGRDGNSDSLIDVELVEASGATTYRVESLSRSSQYSRFCCQTTHTLTSSSYAQLSADEAMVMEITDFDSVVESAVLPMDQYDPADDYYPFYREANARIAFEAYLPVLSTSRYTVSFDLAYAADREDPNPVDLWNSGSIVVTAEDGSELVAIPVDMDADSAFESLSITVDDAEIVRPVIDGYLVSCMAPSLEACNI